MRVLVGKLKKIIHSVGLKEYFRIVMKYILQNQGVLCFIAFVWLERVWQGRILLKR